VEKGFNLSSGKVAVKVLKWLPGPDLVGGFTVYCKRFSIRRIYFSLLLVGGIELLIFDSPVFRQNSLLGLAITIYTSGEAKVIVIQ